MEQSVTRLQTELEQTLTARRGPVGSAHKDRVPNRRGSGDHGPQLGDLLDALPAAIYTTDCEGRITYYNDAAAALWGNRPKLGSSQWCGSWKLFWADGSPMAHRDCPMAIALREDRPVRGIEVACERPDGLRVSFMPYPTPLHDETGRMIGAVNMLVDLGERRRAEEQQALLTRELHHRVKNTLATVQAILGSTARSSSTVAELRDAMIGRIGALAKTHLLLSEEGSTANFDDILRSELDPFDDGTGKRVTLTGPRVETEARLALALGMAIHELTTNAAKFGALSVYGGKVDVTWIVTVSAAARRMLEFDWVESGGPEVKSPTRRGFGARLLDFVLPAQIRAECRIDYRPAGVHVHCALPLPAPTGGIGQPK